MSPFYRIKRLSDGKFSLGGDPPRWGKRGKVWVGSGPLRAHLTMIGEGGVGRQYANAVVVELPSGKEVGPVAEFWKGGRN